jgi:hypothetical protein
MFEKIDTREIFSPVTSATKVKEVNQRDGDMRQKRFVKQLREEEEKNRKRDQNSQQTQTPETEDGEQQGKKSVKADDLELLEDIKADSQGKVIDILA